MKKSIRNILISLAIVIALIMLLSLSACSNESNAETKSFFSDITVDVTGVQAEK